MHFSEWTKTWVFAEGCSLDMAWDQPGIYHKQGLANALARVVQSFSVQLNAKIFWKQKSKNAPKCIPGEIRSLVFWFYYGMSLKEDFKF